MKIFIPLLMFGGFILVSLVEQFNTFKEVCSHTLAKSPRTDFRSNLAIHFDSDEIFSFILVLSYKEMRWLRGDRP